jgi:hypothetical protein
MKRDPTENTQQTNATQKTRYQRQEKRPQASKPNTCH